MDQITQDGQRAGADRPVGEIARQLPGQISRLVREEIRLAQLELAQKGKRAGMGAGMLGGSAVFALYAVAALLAAAIIALALVLPAWASALIVGGALLLIAGVLALLGRGLLKKATPPMPSQARASIKADADEIRERAHR